LGRLGGHRRGRIVLALPEPQRRSARAFFSVEDARARMPHMPKMPLIDLKALLSAERTARTASKLSDERASALSYYMGDMSKDMPAPEGRSKAVSFDVADTIEGLMAPLMDIFAGGEEVVQFAPVGPEDVAAAEQETDYVNHVFMQHNPGFLVLYSFIKDALLSKVGVVSLEFGGSKARAMTQGRDSGLTPLLGAPSAHLWLAWPRRRRPLAG